MTIEYYRTLELTGRTAMGTVLATETIVPLEQTLSERIEGLEAFCAEQARLLDEERRERREAVNRLNAVVGILWDQVNDLLQTRIEEHLHEWHEATKEE